MSKRAEMLGKEWGVTPLTLCPALLKFAKILAPRGENV
jgi:hypothetical protein